MNESLLAAGGGRFLAMVVVHFTARCCQHRSIEDQSQLGKPLEFTSVEAVGCGLGRTSRQLEKKSGSVSRTAPKQNYETKHYQDITPAKSQAQQGNPLRNSDAWVITNRYRRCRQKNQNMDRAKDQVPHQELPAGQDFRAKPA